MITTSIPNKRALAAICREFYLFFARCNMSSAGCSIACEQAPSWGIRRGMGTRKKEKGFALYATWEPVHKLVVVLSNGVCEPTKTLGSPQTPVKLGIRIRKDEKYRRFHLPVIALAHKTCFQMTSNVCVSGV